MADRSYNEHAQLDREQMAAPTKSQTKDRRSAAPGATTTPLDGKHTRHTDKQPRTTGFVGRKTGRATRKTKTRTVDHQASLAVNMLIANLKSENAETVEQTLQEILCNDQAEIPGMLVVPTLMSLLQKVPESLQELILAILKNFVEGDLDVCCYMREMSGQFSGIALLVNLLKDGGDHVKELTSRLLMDLAEEDSEDFTDMIMEEGAGDIILGLLKQKIGTVTKSNLAGLLRNLVDCDDHEEWFVQNGALPEMIKLLRNPDPDVVAHAAGALLHLSVSEEHKQKQIDLGALHILLDILLKDDTTMEHARHEAASVLWNLCCQADGKEKMVAAGLINRLANLAKTTSDIELREKTIGILQNLAVGEEEELMVMRTGILPMVLEMLKSEELHVQATACLALWNLTINELHKTQVVEQGALPLVVKLLNSNDDLVKEKAVAVLWNLSILEANRKPIEEAGAVPPMLKILREGPPLARTKAMAMFRNLSFNVQNKSILVQQGIVEPTIRCLTDYDTEQLRERAAAVLQNLSIFDENEEIIIQEGAAPGLVDMISCSTDVGKEIAASALWNLACTDEHKIKIMEAGAIPQLLRMMENSTVFGMEKASSLIWLLASHDDVKSIMVDEGAIPVLLRCLQKPQAVIQEKCANTLKYFASEKKCREALVTSEAPKEIVRLALQPKMVSAAKEKAVGCLAFLCWSDENEIAIVRAGGLQVAMSMLLSENQSSKEAGAGAIRYMCTKAEHKLKAVEMGVLPCLLALLHDTAAGKEVGIGALRVLAAHQEIKKQLVEEGIVDDVMKMLKLEPLLIQEKLAGLIQNLACGDGTDLLIVKAGAVPLLLAVLEKGSQSAKDTTLAALWNLSMATESKQLLLKTDLLKCVSTSMTQKSITMVAKERALALLWELATVEFTRKSIVESGVMPPALKLLETGSATAKARCCGLLRCISESKDFKQYLLDAGVQPLLIDARVRGTQIAQENATAALLNLGIAKRDQEKLTQQRADDLGVRGTFLSPDAGIRMKGGLKDEDKTSLSCLACLMAITSPAAAARRKE